jgi:hypothetical protein
MLFLKLQDTLTNNEVNETIKSDKVCLLFSYYIREKTLSKNKFDYFSLK